MWRPARTNEIAAGLARLMLAWLAGLTPASANAQSVERGRQLYEARCSACHSVDANRTGPMHAGVLGRRAGSVPGFNYSPALAHSSLVWSQASLLQWLANPEALIPGQAMNFQVPDLQDRQDLVAYLASLQPLISESTPRPGAGPP